MHLHCFSNIFIDFILGYIPNRVSGFTYFDASMYILLCYQCFDCTYRLFCNCALQFFLGINKVNERCNTQSQVVGNHGYFYINNLYMSKDIEPPPRKPKLGSSHRAQVSTWNLTWQNHTDDNAFFIFFISLWRHASRLPSQWERRSRTSLSLKGGGYKPL